MSFAWVLGRAGQTAVDRHRRQTGVGPLFVDRGDHRVLHVRDLDDCGRRGAPCRQLGHPEQPEYCGHAERAEVIVDPSCATTEGE